MKRYPTASTAMVKTLPAPVCAASTYISHDTLKDTILFNTHYLQLVARHRDCIRIRGRVQSEGVDDVVCNIAYERWLVWQEDGWKVHKYSIYYAVIL
jgi:acyl-coenzyme A thioesterase PaaI-like protein